MSISKKLKNVLVLSRPPLPWRKTPAGTTIHPIKSSHENRKMQKSEPKSKWQQTKRLGESLAVRERGLFQGATKRRNGVSVLYF
jgi:hypothetical protein